MVKVYILFDMLFKFLNWIFKRDKAYYDNLAFNGRVQKGKMLAQYCRIKKEIEPSEIFLVASFPNRTDTLQAVIDLIKEGKLKPQFLSNDMYETVLEVFQIKSTSGKFYLLLLIDQYELNNDDLVAGFIDIYEPISIPNEKFEYLKFYSHRKMIVKR